MNIIDFNKVTRYFEYDQDTGILYNKITRSGRAKIGDEAGAVKKDGYKHVCFDYKTYFVHRVIFVLVTGNQPDEVDHINHDRSDNRWANLRSVSRLENARNCSISSNNTSGVTGVSYSHANKKWKCSMPGAKPLYFDTFEKAVFARGQAEIDEGYHINHGSAI